MFGRALISETGQTKSTMQIPLRISLSALVLTGFIAVNCMAEGRPNIVFILADDHNRQTISAYSDLFAKIAPTPHIDRLAAEGIRFDSMAVNNSICGPSRAALLTGTYNHLNGVRSNRDKFDGSQQTFPKLMQRAGYETAIFGKWHLGSEPTGFDHYAVIPGQGKFFDCQFHETGKSWYTGAVAKGYLTDVITDKAIAWLERRPKDKPFLLMVHHKAPHVPHEPATRHERFLEDVTLPEPANLLDTYEERAIGEVEESARFSRIAINVEVQYQDLAKQFSGDREAATRKVNQAFVKGYLQLVKSLDENVGRLLQHIDEAGLRENTLVIYASDNGFFSGEHGLYNKMWMYEESLFVPFIARYPGIIAPGSRTRCLASLLDVAPTFVELAGATVPPDLQGISLLPLLRGKDTPLRESLYYHYHADWGVPEIVGLRTPTHKLIHYPGLEKVRWELFDLEKDPGEMNNLAGKAKFRPLLDTLKKQLAESAVKFKDPIAPALAAP
jgi:arylsulfatase A-like enzyme